MNHSGPYLQVSEAAGRAFVMRRMDGPIVMLNLLRFRATADYTAAPELAPPAPVSGADAFARYIEHTLPYLRESGGDLEFIGNGGPFLIGPPDEHWDLVLLVRHRSVDSFLSFAQHEAYLEGIAHRTAAIEDSRLLPISQVHEPRGNS